MTEKPSLNELMAALPPLTADSPAIERLAQHAIGLMRAARDLRDPEMVSAADYAGLLAGRKLARHMTGNGSG